MNNTPLKTARSPFSLLAASLMGAALFIQPLPAYAAGGGDSTPKPTACPNGKVWSTKKQKCVRIHSNSLNDEERYRQGWALATHGQYEKAIEVLRTADQSDPRVLNYLGYSHRKSGDLKTGISYYRQALAINPKFALAHEYLGEGYVKAGRLDLAKLELDQIKNICGTGCTEYTQLAQAILTGTESSNW